MSVAFFVMSTGRCSTQYLAHELAKVAPDCLIEHEPIRYQYLSRKVFRQPKEFKRVLGGNIALQRKLIEIEDTLAKNTRYVDVGWPTYAWLPYLSFRFQKKFEFSHLVRNPFQCAASMLTQGFYTGGSANYVRTSVIHGNDPKVAFPQFNTEFDSFTPYEKCLYHWVELNRFLLNFHGHKGFRGLYKFEQLYGNGPSGLDDFASMVIGRPMQVASKQAYDQVQRQLSEPIKLHNYKLVDIVVETATKLGYELSELQSSFDIDVLNSLYSSKRLS